MKKEKHHLCLLNRLKRKNYKTLVILFLLLWNTHLSAQVFLQLKIDSIYSSNVESENKIQKVIQLIQTQDTSKHTLQLGYAYHKLGLLYNRTKQYQEAIDITLKAVYVRELNVDTETRDLNNSLFNISIYLNKLERKIEEEVYLKKIIDSNSTDRFHYKALNSLAVLQSDKGDYFAALDYLKLLIHTIDKEKFELTLIRAHEVSIRIYSEMPNCGKYIHEILEHEKQLKSYSLIAEEMTEVNMNLGIIYSRMGNNVQAIEHYFKVLPIYKLYQDSIGLGRLFINLGIQYSIINQADKANSYFNHALTYVDQKGRAYIYDNQGFYLHATDPRQQLEFYQKAINAILDKEEVGMNIKSLPELSLIEKSNDRLDILFFLIDKAKAWLNLYEKENDRQPLLDAKETLYLVDQLISIIRLDSKNEKSKLFWISRGVDSYVLAVQVCYLLNQPEEAFYFMEKNKSLLLLEYLDTEDKGKTRFLDILALNEAIEKHVTKQVNLVEYIINDEEGFGVFCFDDGIYLFELNNVPLLIREMAQMKKMIKRPFISKREFGLFDELSSSVFNTLFPFEEAFSLLEEKELIVIPDFELHNLPFEVLITQQNDSHFEKNYLIKIAEISYLHSCSVSQQIDNVTNQNKQEMVGFVPTVFQNDTLAELRLSEIEMKNIATFFPSRLMLREQATKQVFIESLDKYSIIHINSHAGYTENSTPWLSFYDQKVSLEELMTFSNHSNLVILDACKSALGEQELGEGIMSLARAFFYGGTSSVIAAQWQVNEKSSGVIFNKFYKNLKAGESKSAALHHAKLSYLASNQLSQLSPYYWAAFTLTGDAGFVSIEKHNYWMMKMAAVLFFIFLFTIKKNVFLKKKRHL